MFGKTAEHAHAAVLPGDAKSSGSGRHFVVTESCAERV